MNAPHRWSTRLYAALLPLYPSDLRRDFGPDMVEAFARDLDDALTNRGAAAAFRVWRRAAWELLRIALPGQKDNPAVAVPVILFAFCETLWSVQLILVLRDVAGIPGLVLWPSLIAAFTSLAAVCAGNRSLPSPLHLGPASCSKSII